jgi:hypothetical protein
VEGQREDDTKMKGPRGSPCCAPSQLSAGLSLSLSLSSGYVVVSYLISRYEIISYLISIR